MPDIVRVPRQETRTPKEAASVVRRWMTLVGYSDVQVMGEIAKSEATVRATGVTARVSHDFWPVVRKSIERLLVAAQDAGSVAMFFTFNMYADPYTAAAESWANNAGVALFDMSGVGGVFPANEVAEAIVAESGVEVVVEPEAEIEPTTGWVARNNQPPFWSDSVGHDGLAALTRWLAESLSEKAPHNSLMGRYWGTQPSPDLVTRRRWFDLTLWYFEGQSGASTDLMFGGFSDSEVEAGRRVLRATTDGAPSADDASDFECDTDESGYEVWALTWDGDPGVCAGIIEVITEQAGMPLDDGGWRFTRGDIQASAISTQE